MYDGTGTADYIARADVTFSLKPAFDNNWIGSTFFVSLGILAGLGMLWLGRYLHRRYSPLAQALGGGGIVVIYLSIFAASVLYNMIAFDLAFIFLLSVSVVAAAIACAYDSMTLAVIAIVSFTLPWLVIYQVFS